MHPVTGREMRAFLVSMEKWGDRNNNQIAIRQLRRYIDLHYPDTVDAVEHQRLCRMQDEVVQILVTRLHVYTFASAEIALNITSFLVEDETWNRKWWSPTDQRLILDKGMCNRKRDVHKNITHYDKLVLSRIQFHRTQIADRNKAARKLAKKNKRKRQEEGKTQEEIQARKEKRRSKKKALFLRKPLAQLVLQI